MKHLTLAAMLAALTIPVTAVQAAEAKHAATAKPATTKSASAKPAAPKAASAKTKDAKNAKAPAPKTEAPTSTAAFDETLTPTELEIAKKVYVGKIDCELGASVLIAADEARPGFFNITSGKRTFYMHPVPSRTGAVRMEDSKREAMYLQLAAKSMLMDQKAGQRMADECKSPDQIAFAAQMKDHPPPNLLDAPKTALLPLAGATASQPPAQNAAALTEPSPSLTPSGEKNVESLP